MADVTSTPPFGERYGDTVVDRDVAAKCLDLTYRRLPVSVGMAVAVPLAFVGLLTPQFQTGEVARWFATVSAGTAARVVLWLAWRRSGGDAKRFDPRGLRFWAVTTLAALGWTVGGLLLLASTDARGILMVAVMLFAVTVIGSNSLAFHLASAQTFALVILVPIVVAMLTWPDPVVHVSGLSLGVGTVALVATMGFIDREARRAMKTERRLAAAMAEAIDARLAAEDASRAKSEFLANISHELRTPLNAIIGYAELLQEEAAERAQPGVLDDLAKIDKAGKHLLGLISEVLDFSRIEAGEMAVLPEEFDIRSLVDTVEATTRGLTERAGNTFRINCPADIGTMEADPVLLRQILVNLLGNAAKFTSGGRVWLDVTRHADAGTIDFLVGDTGIGIDAATQSRLFQPFSQGDSSMTRRFGGTGLGLAICQRLSLMMGGSITLHSEPGVGSILVVTLPVRGAPDSSRRSQSAARDDEARPVEASAQQARGK